MSMKYKSYHLVLRPRSLLIAKTTTQKRVKKTHSLHNEIRGISLVYTYCTCHLHLSSRAGCTVTRLENFRKGQWLWWMRGPIRLGHAVARQLFFNNQQKWARAWLMICFAFQSVSGFSWVSWGEKAIFSNSFHSSFQVSITHNSDSHEWAR